jgi:small subunit ribosomal protein S28e
MAEEKTETPKVEEAAVEKVEEKVETPKAEVKTEKAEVKTEKAEATPDKSETPKEKEDKPKAAAPEEKPKAKDTKGSSVEIHDATPGQVVKVFKKSGLYGECYQVLVRVLEGRDKGNLLRRNIRGPVKENDMIMLKETERDARAV